MDAKSLPLKTTLKMSSDKRLIRGISFEQKILAELDEFAQEVGLSRSECANLLLSLVLQGDEAKDIIRKMRGVETTK